jgi:hypothetical protein
MRPAVDELFPKFARSRTEPKRRGEKLFDFYNECARAGYEEFRSFVNQWVAELPVLDQVKVISSMSRGDDRQFQSGLVELLVHAFLRRLNQRVLLHPIIEGSSNRPDFALLDRDDLVQAYVEVTTINPASDTVSGDNREALIYNAIDRIDLPVGCVFGYDVVRAGASSPPLGRLISEIKAWVKESCAGKIELKVTRRFVASDWELELDLFSGGSIKYDRAIGISSGGFGWIAPHLDLRATLELKAKRYGKLQAPYLIVVADAKGQLFGANDVKEAVTEALLGDDVVRLDESHVAKLTHKRNGFWLGSKSPRNIQVSGVMLFPDVGLWGLRSENLQPILAVNPWACVPLPDFFKVVSRFETENEEWKFSQGENFADILGLPTPWPPK